MGRTLAGGRLGGVPMLRAADAGRPAAAACLALMGAAALAICVEAGARATTVVPPSVREYPGWLRGPLPEAGDGLTEARFAALFLVMCGCYLALLTLHRRLGARIVIGAIVGLHALFLLAPPLLSTDVFGYIDWARLGTVHGLDPYAHGATDANHDPVRTYMRWHSDAPSPYGPLFTLATYALAPLGIAGSFWAIKAITALASLGCLAVVWACAKRLGRDPLPAVVFVGLNPVLLVWEVGGAHNDTWLMLPALAGVYLALAGREAAAGAAIMCAAAVKASACLLLPFALLGAARRGRTLAGAAAAFVVLAGISLAAFGANVGGFLRTLLDQQDQVALWSVPNSLGRWLGLGGLTPGVRAVAIGLFAIVLVLMLVRAARGGDWIACAGWATFALLATTAWLLPWYVVWLLPLAALADDRRLRIAALAMCAWVIAVRVPVWLETPLYP